MSRKKSPLFHWKDLFKADRDLTSTQKLVAHTLATHMNSKGDSCFPGRELVAREASLSLRAVIDAIAGLEDAGYLVVTRGGTTKEGGKFPSQYVAAIQGVPVQQLHPYGCSTFQGGVQEVPLSGAGGAPKDVKSFRTPMRANPVPCTETGRPLPWVTEIPSLSLD